jgi:biotin transport system ATP-binding protein
MSEIIFSARRLVKAFHSGDETFRALDGIDLDIYRRQCVVISGANGSGKTVLMKIIAGLIEADSGELTRSTAPGSIGLVFQDPDAQFLGETVLEDAAFGPQNRGFSREAALERAAEALAGLGLSSLAHRPPRRLSGGEKRRLAIAGVLAMGCETVIMDEPFANLDWPSVRQTLEAIAGLKTKGISLIILTHELEKVLSFADRLVILYRGRICEDGVPETVLGRLTDEYGVRNPLQSYTDVKDCTWL